MTAERAREILRFAREEADQRGGPWPDQLDRVLREGERAEINAVWDTMSGSTCFVDALRRIAHPDTDGAEPCGT